MTAYLHLIDQRRLIGPGGSTVSGTIYFYYSSTSVLAPIYQDAGLTVPASNPVSVAAGAVVPVLYLDSSITYKRRIVYSDGSVDEQDPLGFLFSGDALGIPVGTIIDYPGPTVPNEYLLCAGQEVSRTTYSDLFAAIGTTYGSGNGTTTFNLPDLRGRVIAGKDNMGGTPANRLTTEVTGSTLGATGGTEDVTLDSSQIPSHSHTVNDPGHVHTINNPVIDTTGSLSAPPGGGLGIRSTYNTTSSTTGITLSNTGGGGAHSNVQPTIIFNKIIKATKTTALSLIDLIPVNRDFIYGNPSLGGGLFGIDDGMSLTNIKETTELSGTRTKANIGRTIIINDAGASPAAGPGTASYGLSIYGQRPSWNTSSLTGEMDGISIALRQANGDSAAILTNVLTRNGFGCALESYTGVADSTGAPTKAVNVQVGVSNSRDDAHYGLVVQSVLGTNLNAGIRIAQNSGTSFNNFIEMISPTGTTMAYFRAADGAFIGGTVAPQTDLGANQGGPSNRYYQGYFYRLNLSGLPVYPDVASATAAGEVSGTVFKNASGQLFVT